VLLTQRRGCKGSWLKCAQGLDLRTVERHPASLASRLYVHPLCCTHRDMAIGAVVTGTAACGLPRLSRTMVCAFIGIQRLPWHVTSSVGKCNTEKRDKLMSLQVFGSVRSCPWPLFGIL
jgi:hypothetical protein